jgi:predicted dehydrogenase
MLKVGILGMGAMGWKHTSKYFQIPGAKLVAIADTRPERLEAKELVASNIAGDGKPIDLSAVARYSDASQLIAEADVDVVDVCLPTLLHTRYAVEALEARRHVLCEKPIALTLEEADQMIEAAKKADRLLMVAQCVRFWPEYQFLRQSVHENKFGRLLSLNMYRLSERPTWSVDNWMGDHTRSGGTTYDLHIHDVDYANYLLGPPDRIQATGRKSEATGSYDIIHACYNYDNGPQVHIYAGWTLAQLPFHQGYEAWFERSVIRFDSRSDPTLQIYDDLAQGRPAEYQKGDAYTNEIAYFLNCVAKGEPPAECPPESARDSVRLVKKELAAIESGQTVSGRD